mmetsp:Transcript_19468/g.22272  ORF Transcript_19468/g.22272 Transcript_19468/m.22272 type:complete len:157 (-) Transcript_19468:165-635(-)
MKMFRFVLILLSLFVAVADGVPKPLFASRTICPLNSFGGLPKQTLQVRGGEVLELSPSPEELDSILIRAAGSLVVLDFWADWCGPCKMIAPVFSQLSEEFDDVIFVKVDVDSNPNAAAKYSVSAMPTFLFLKNGDVVDRLMGANPERLRELILEHK